MFLSRRNTWLHATGDAQWPEKDGSSMIRTLLRSDTTVAIRGPDQLRGGLERGHVVSRSDLISHVLTLFLTLSFLELKVKGDQKIKNTALNEITASTGFRTR